MKFNDAEITPRGYFCVVLFLGESSLDSLSWTCTLTIENLEDTTHCDGRAVSAWARPPHRFFHYTARRRPLPGSYHTLEHPSCSHPIATGGNPANPIDPPTDPVLTRRKIPSESDHARRHAASHARQPRSSRCSDCAHTEPPPAAADQRAPTVRLDLTRLPLIFDPMTLHLSPIPTLCDVIAESRRSNLLAVSHHTPCGLVYLSASIHGNRLQRRSA